MLNRSHHHKQIFNDAEEDATLKKLENDERWMAWFIKNVVGTIRRSVLAPFHPR